MANESFLIVAHLHFTTMDSKNESQLSQIVTLLRHYEEMNRGTRMDIAKSTALQFHSTPFERTTSSSNKRSDGMDLFAIFSKRVPPVAAAENRRTLQLCKSGKTSHVLANILLGTNRTKDTALLHVILDHLPLFVRIPSRAHRLVDAVVALSRHAHHSRRVR